MFCLGILRILLLCVARIGAFTHQAPECFPAGHRTLRNSYRSVDFDSTEIQNTAIQDLICDHSLLPGWYRFRINNKLAEMPTSCVEMNRCGTQAPVWLSLKDTSLPRTGEVRQLSACATWQFYHGSTKDCCLFRIPITVRNCGNFLVYYLQPTQGCMGYCAQVVTDLGARPCPPGEVEVSGRCKAALPSLASRPVITPELIGHSVHLKCSFVPPPWSQTLGFQVVWARHIGHSMKAEIRQESTLKPFSLVEMDGVHFRLGEKFSCSVSTFTVNSSHGKSAPKESESFYAGLKFSPESLHIAENGEEHEVIVHSSVPIPCFSSDLGQPCGVSLGLSTNDPDSLGHEASNVVLSVCQVEVKPNACNSGSCGETRFRVTAVSDFTRDGNRPSLIGAVPGSTAPRLWRNYKPTPLKVMVQDVPTSICYSLTDPHIITLDGRRYENHQTGTFVLYQSLGREFEVHTRQWDCSSRHYSVACNCGFAAREGNEVAIFDMCSGRPQETRPKLTLKNLGDHEGSRVRVLESQQGKKVTLMFPSGAFVRADVADWGMSLSIRAPSIDFSNTRGLCGTFDRNSNNDFYSPAGFSYSFDHVHQFIEDWRISPGESLFDRTPPGTEEVVRRPFCRCQAGYRSTQDFVGDTRNNPSTHSDVCVSYDNVDVTSVFPSMDTTLEYIKSVEIDERFLNMSVFKGRPKDDLLSSDRPKRQHFEFQPVFMSLNQADLEGFNYFFPEDHLAEARPEVQLSWPTPSGLTLTKALEVCQMSLVNSTVGTVCGNLLGRRLNEAVDLCILDLQLKDDLSWDEALLPFLENDCERWLLENRSRRDSEMVGWPRASGEVVTALRCPNFCSGKGECTDWGCECFPNYSFHDCSIAISQPVEITDLENSGLCDIRSFDCRSVRVFGLGFIESPDLSCHATRLKYINKVWQPGEQQRTTATFLSSKALDCTIPSLSNAAVKEEFTMDDKPYARWEVKVTNDGLRYSQAKVLTIYDGVCQVCDASRSGLCKLKEQTCNIDSMCFAAGDSNPSSPCLLCDPNLSRFSWSVNQVNEPPTFHLPQGELQTFSGENFVFQFAASDVEGSALLFQLEDGPAGAVLSPAGLLIWRVPLVLEEEEERLLESQSFRFTVSDECNAHSSVTVEVSILPCGCRRGGTCVTDVNFSTGSGKYLCVCPEGAKGELCDEDEDGCLSSPCSAGECVTSASGFRCRCPAGLKGLTCQEDINECENRGCFPGSWCINSFGSYSCGPCPRGMLGNGTTCTAAVPSTPATRITPDVQPQPQKTNKSDKTRVELRHKASASAWRWTQELTSVAVDVGPGSQFNVSLRKPSETGNQSKTMTGTTAALELERTRVAPGINVSATCASRPCFPGVQCINRRPPYVGYVCGRCPPGLYGNGRFCVKNMKEATAHLQQQTVMKLGRSTQGNKASQLHLPHLSSRREIKLLSSPVTRGNHAHRLAAVTSRGGRYWT
uniref:Uncharacterized protein n=2 Tax=Gouania willdenowi TaxID=441366 RepID=A0A8C5NAQ0_GOUWI